MKLFELLEAVANPYAVLGLARSASQDEIKQAYRRLAMKLHPDRGGKTSDFQELEAAYAQLTKSPTSAQPAKSSSSDSRRVKYIDDDAIFDAVGKDLDNVLSKYGSKCTGLKGNTIWVKFADDNNRMSDENLDLRDFIEGLDDDDFNDVLRKYGFEFKEHDFDSRLTPTTAKPGMGYNDFHVDVKPL